MCSTSVSCPLCYQSSFPNIDTLRNSLIKAANGPVSCPICNEVLLGLDKLTIHLFSHTQLLLTNSRETISPPCTVSIGPQLATVKREASTSPKRETILISTADLAGNCSPTSTIISNNPDVCASQIKCDICELTFRSVELLRLHNRLIHRVPDEAGGSTAVTDVRYQCHLCAKIFKMKGSLRVHLKVVHLVGLQTNKDSPKLNLCQKIKNKSLQGVVPVTVTITNQPVTTPLETVTYPNNNNDNYNDGDDCKPIISDNARPNGSATSTRATEAPKIWECDICSKSFTTKYFLKKHKRLHTGEMPYTCNICGKTFTFQQSYHKHLLYHSDEKPHSCQTCGRAFKELSTLHNHERIHSGEKPFECETCGKCFRQRVSYLVHKRIHTGAMPYKCTACEKSFRYKVSQRTHKCTAQPPGTVIRQGGDLLEKLLQSTSIIPTKLEEETTEELSTALNVEHIVNNNELIPSEQHHDEDLLIRSIDEIVSESCHKMGIKSFHEIEAGKSDVNSNKQSQPDENNIRTPSPSEKLENLCLYSPCDNSLISPFDTICEEALKTILSETG